MRIDKRSTKVEINEVTFERDENKNAPSHTPSENSAVIKPDQPTPNTDTLEVSD